MHETRLTIKFRNLREKKEEESSGTLIERRVTEKESRVGGGSAEIKKKPSDRRQTGPERSRSASGR